MNSQRERRSIAAPRHSVLGGLVFAALAFGVAAVGAISMRSKGRPDGRWFRRLRKPSFQPPNEVFGPVWTVLYGAIAYSGHRIWRAPASPQRTRALALWSAQLALNGAWTPIFFGARRPALALADLVALDVAAGAYALSSRRVDRRASLAVVPYLGWLAFATALNAGIVAGNQTAR